MVPIDESVAKLLIAKHWELVCSVTDIYSETEPILVEIFDRYSEPNRAYHNLIHIAKMLLIIGGQDEYPEDLCELSVATIFHDIIYDRQAKDNEERSAEYAMRVFGLLGFENEFLTKVNAYILGTKHHVVDPFFPHTATMIDADLSILGAPYDEYQEYAEAIRQEYSFVGEEAYRVGRTAVLNSFLNRKKIYLVPWFRDKFETQARVNIDWEIETLKT